MRAAICLLAVATATAGYAQDVTITSKVTREGTTSTTTNYVTSDHARFSEPNGNDVIVDLKSGDITIVDAKKKQYSVMTQKDMDDFFAMMNERMNSPEMQRMQEQMKNLPPEAKQRMQSMMGDAMKASVEKTGTSRTIAGYKCENYSVTIGQFSKAEHCLSTAVKLPPQAWDRYKKFSETVMSMRGAMGPMASGMDKMRAEMAKLKGFPLATTTTTTIMGRTSTSASEVTSIKYGPVPASAWDVPAGYAKVDSPLKQAMTRRGRG